MKVDRIWLTACIVVFGVATQNLLPALPQAKFGKQEFDGEFQGFTKSPEEHIINRWPELITVSRVAGQIVATSNAETLADALFEIRGPGKSKRIRSTNSDGGGKFALKRAPPGEYIFKVTLNGFQSVVGRIRVDRRISTDHKIKITLHLGV